MTLATSSTAQLPDDAEEGVVTLEDGRQLAWASSGDGPAVIWCHGSMGGRLDLAYAKPGALPARIVAFDRPGQGRSTRAKGRTLVDSAGDVEQLADALGIERFVVVGYSMGGPYALAVGALLGDRVDAVGVIAGMPPLDAAGLAATPGPAPLFELARDSGVDEFERLLSSGLYPVTREKIGAFLSQFEAGTDGAYLRANPRVVEVVTDVCVDSAQQGPGGWADDHVAIAADWGIDWSAFQPPVVIFQGEDDPLVLPAAATLVAERLTRVSVRLVPDRGHYGWITAMGDVFDELLSHV